MENRSAIVDTRACKDPENLTRRHGTYGGASNIPYGRMCPVKQPGSEPGESAALMHSRKTARPCPSLPVPDISCFRCPERICQGPGQPAMHKSCQSLLRLPFCCLMSEGAGQGKNDPGIQPMVKKSAAQNTDCRFFPEKR